MTIQRVDDIQCHPLPLRPEVPQLPPIVVHIINRATTDTQRDHHATATTMQRVNLNQYFGDCLKRLLLASLAVDRKILKSQIFLSLFFLLTPLLQLSQLCEYFGLNNSLSKSSSHFTITKTFRSSLTNFLLSKKCVMCELINQNLT